MATVSPTKGNPWLGNQIRVNLPVHASRVKQNSCITHRETKQRTHVTDTHSPDRHQEVEQAFVTAGGIGPVPKSVKIKTC